MWQERIDRLGSLVETGGIGFGALWAAWALFFG